MHFTSSRSGTDIFIPLLHSPRESVAARVTASAPLSRTSPLDISRNTHPARVYNLLATATDTARRNHRSTNEPPRRPGPRSSRVFSSIYWRGMRTHWLRKNRWKISSSLPPAETPYSAAILLFPAMYHGTTGGVSFIPVPPRLGRAGETEIDDRSPASLTYYRPRRDTRYPRERSIDSANVPANGNRHSVGKNALVPRHRARSLARPRPITRVLAKHCCFPACSHLLIVRLSATGAYVPHGGVPV